MMKFVKAVYVYGLYIIGAPLFLAFTVVVLIVHLIANKKDFGEFCVKESVMAYYEGIRAGHEANKCFINSSSVEEYWEAFGKKLG